MIKSSTNGHDIYYDENNTWRYTDNNELASTERKCNKCGCKPTKEGYDSCIGFLKGVKYACCGHGKDKPYAILDDNQRLEFNDINQMKDYFHKED